MRPFWFLLDTICKRKTPLEMTLDEMAYGNDFFLYQNQYNSTVISVIKRAVHKMQ